MDLGYTLGGKIDNILRLFGYKDKWGTETLAHLCLSNSVEGDNVYWNKKDLKENQRTMSLKLREECFTKKGVVNCVKCCRGIQVRVGENSTHWIWQNGNSWYPWQMHFQQNRKEESHAARGSEIWGYNWRGKGRKVVNGVTVLLFLLCFVFKIKVSKACLLIRAT